MERGNDVTTEQAPKDRRQILLDAGERMIIDTGDLEIAPPKEEK
jgi:hypothetical protein